VNENQSVLITGENLKMLRQTELGHRGALLCLIANTRSTPSRLRTTLTSAIREIIAYAKSRRSPRSFNCVFGDSKESLRERERPGPRSNVAHRARSFVRVRDRPIGGALHRGDELLRPVALPYVSYFIDMRCWCYLDMGRVGHGAPHSYCRANVPVTSKSLSAPDGR